jgi:hypothetical protein
MKKIKILLILPIIIGAIILWIIPHIFWKIWDVLSSSSIKDLWDKIDIALYRYLPPEKLSNWLDK